MPVVKLNFVLIGKAGCGRSSTGNTILGRKVFITSCNSVSASKTVDYSSCHFGQYLLHVVDTPSVIDPDIDWDESETASISNMDTAVRTCFGGVDAFLLVLQFPCKFTLEDMLTLVTLKKIFGERLMNHVIVVLTYGDLFQDAMKDEDRNDNFEEWCGKQVGQLRQLYDVCEGRFVLFNNREKNVAKKQEQTLKLVQLAQMIQAGHGRYKTEYFNAVETKCTTTIQNKTLPEQNKQEVEKAPPSFPPEQHYPQIQTSFNIDNQMTPTVPDRRGQVLDQKTTRLSVAVIPQQKVPDLITETRNSAHPVDAPQLLPQLRCDNQISETRASPIIPLLQEDNQAAGGFQMNNVLENERTMNNSTTVKKVTVKEVRLNLLLIGKTGQGKSATGNTILNKQRFEASANLTSQTKKVDFSFAQLDEFILLVVDGPGMEDTDLGIVQNREAAVTNMDQALAMCYGGVDAFLLIIKFGQRLTTEDKSTFLELKRVFGQGFTSHVIIVMTHGDLFSGAMKEETRDISFKEWCREQSQHFCGLYEECEGRIVLIDNRMNEDKNNTKWRMQIQEVVHFAADLQTRKGQYTSENFQKADIERKQFILANNAPELTREMQEKLCLLNADIDSLPEKPTDSDKEKIKERIQNLKTEIEFLDQGSGVLQDYLELIIKLEENIDNVLMLRRLRKELEHKRKTIRICNILGWVNAVLIGVLTFIAPPTGIAVGFATSCTNRLLSNERRRQESKLLKKITNIQAQLKEKHLEHMTPMLMISNTP